VDCKTIGMHFELLVQKEVNMNFLENKKILRDLLRQGDLMNTVNGGVRETHFKIEKSGKDLVVELANPSIKPESFNFTIHGNELMINVMQTGEDGEQEQSVMYPMFFKVVKIPYFVDINRIEAYYEKGVFKVFMPYNNNLPQNPFRIHIQNLDN
jgi:HSP20 family protein